MDTCAKGMQTSLCMSRFGTTVMLLKRVQQKRPIQPSFSTAKPTMFGQTYLRTLAAETCLFVGGRIRDPL
jgi:hypothetical protein